LINQRVLQFFLREINIWVSRSLAFPIQFMTAENAALLLCAASSYGSRTNSEEPITFTLSVRLFTRKFIRTI
jgi:hypothetical protein